MPVTLAWQAPLWVGDRERETEYAMRMKIECEILLKRDVKGRKEGSKEKGERRRGAREKKRDCKLPLQRRAEPSLPDRNGQSLPLKGTDYCLCSSFQVTGRASIILT